MEPNDEDLLSNSKYLLSQLITARKEINNLRQQLKNLKYIHEKDVNSIKQLLGLYTNNHGAFDESSPFEFRRQQDLATNFISNAEPSTSKNLSKNCLNLNPIGVITTWFPRKRGTPRQPVICSKVPGKLTLNKNIFTNPEHALEGLGEFSHMWILFHFHKNEMNHIKAKIAPPRLNGLKTGIFSTRSPHRPCPIGLSLVRIIKIDGISIFFEGVDMVDQTPVLDIKPYIPQYDNPRHNGKFLHASRSEEDVMENSENSNLLMNCSRQRPFGKFGSDQDLRELSSMSPLVLADISRDEELALRLQTEEFDDNINRENLIDPREGSNTLDDEEIVTIIANRDNLHSIDSDLLNSEINRNEDQIIRNSRLFDGADRPNIVCGAEIDVVNRRTLNLRISNESSTSTSPVRMGVREAPDGEEGFESPLIRNSTSNANSVDDENSIFPQSNLPNIADGLDDVRVPEWITSPKTSSLKVVFSERSLAQLEEISAENMEEKQLAIENVLREDPRSVYLRQRYGNQFYTFLIRDLHITCKFDDERKLVIVFQIRHAGQMCECGEPEWQCSGHLSQTNNSKN